eukprot:scaffold30248_cov52-Attheya_sp.AAC.5
MAAVITSRLIEGREDPVLRESVETECPSSIIGKIPKSSYSAYNRIRTVEGIRNLLTSISTSFQKYYEWESKKSTDDDTTTTGPLMTTMDS